MTRSWLSIRVELVEGRGEHLWPRPGRVLVAARSHTFAAFAIAIDDAFARWDRAHLHEFCLADGTRLGPGEHFLYAFDLGDGWVHVGTVGTDSVDPGRARDRADRPAAVIRLGRAVGALGGSRRRLPVPDRAPRRRGGTDAMTMNVLTDSTTMLRRSLRRMRCYPSLTLFIAGIPVVLLLLFVYVFGGTLGVGLGAPGLLGVAGGVSASSFGREATSPTWSRGSC